MHPQLLARSCGVLALCVALSGCADAESVRSLTQGIIGGAPTGDAHGEVVFVTTIAQGRVKQCSGTLIAPNLVLTALHCVSTKNPTQGVLCDDMGHPASADNSSLLGPPVKPGNVAVYVGPIPAPNPDANVIQVIGSGSATICENDLAFVVLDRALSLPIAPLRLDTPASVGEELTVVGFGQNSTGASEDRQERTVQVTATGQWIRTFTVSEGPCLGDSGGPALTANGKLSGVFSTVSLDCSGADAAGKYTDISHFGPLVQRAFAAANGELPSDAGSADAGALETGDANEADAANETGDAGAAGAAGTSAALPQPSSTLSAHGGCSVGHGQTDGWAQAILGLFAARLWRRRPKVSAHAET